MLPPTQLKNLQVYHHDRFIVGCMSMTCAPGLVCQWCLLLKTYHYGRFNLFTNCATGHAMLWDYILASSGFNCKSTIVIDLQISPNAQHEVCSMTHILPSSHSLGCKFTTMVHNYWFAFISPICATRHVLWDSYAS